MNSQRLEAERERRVNLVEDLDLARKFHRAYEAMYGSEQAHVFEALQAAESLQAEFDAADVTVSLLQDSVASDTVLLEEIDSLLALGVTPNQ